MNNYKISNEAKEDLIRIYNYGVQKFGLRQANKYYDSFFEYFETIAENPFSFKAADHIKFGYRRCPCGLDTIYFRLHNNVIEIVAIVVTQDLDNIL